MNSEVGATKDFGQEGPPAPDADVIIIGAGPAGMSAAIELAKSGGAPIVLDLQPTPGGQIFRNLESNLAARPQTDALLGALGPAYLTGGALITSFRSQTKIDFRAATTVWELRADGTVGWLKDGKAGYLRAKRVILANGAMERPTPFPGWTLPGVMTAGAVQTLLKAGRLKPAGRIVLAGTGPLIFLLAEQLRRLDVKPVLIARTDTFKDKRHAFSRLRPAAMPAIFKGLNWVLSLHLGGIPMLSGVTGLQAIGAGKVEAVTMTARGRAMEVPCDMLIVHDGVVPSVDLAHGAGLALEWTAADLNWRPKTSLEGLAELSAGPAFVSGTCRVHVTGDARAIGGADAAIAHGRQTAKHVLAMLQSEHVDQVGQSPDLQRAMAARPFLDRAFPVGLGLKLPEDDTIVCRCEELTAGDLRRVIRSATHDMNSVRGLLRCGMGPCQGRSCSATLARLLAEAQGGSPSLPFRARPPVRPLPLEALAGLTGVDPDLAGVISLGDKPEASEMRG